jgi:hypothetical protein
MVKQVHGKMLNIFGYLGSSGENHSEIAHPTHKIIANVGEYVEKLTLSYNCWYEHKIVQLFGKTV